MVVRRRGPSGHPAACTHGLRAFLLLNVLATVGTGSALAAPCAAVSSGSTSFQCTDDLHNGLNFNNSGVSNTTSLSSSTTSITITKLTSDINGTVTFNVPTGDTTHAFSLTHNDLAHRIYTFGGNAVLVSARDQTFNWFPTSQGGTGRPAQEPTLSVSINNSVNVQAGGAGAPISILSQGQTGSGGSGDGGSGRGGRFPRPVVLNLSTPPSTGGLVSSGGLAPSTAVPTIYAASIGGRGGGGTTGVTSSGGAGGLGAEGSNVTMTVSSGWTLYGAQTNLLLLSRGGSGGGGGTGSFGNGGGGGAGADAQTVSLTTSSGPGLLIANTSAVNSPAIQLLSQGGNGGNGGSGATFGGGGRGGTAGWGGTVTATGGWTITTGGTGSAGFVARSIGGVGGNGGDGGVFSGGGGGGGSSGSAGPASVTMNAGSIETRGADSPGMIVQSVAGHGGAAGDQYGLVSFSASGGSAGNAGQASFTAPNNNFAITTHSDVAPALLVQSIGGGGGSGGGGVGAFYAAGSSGGNGGYGSAASVYLWGGRLTTSGSDSAGVLAQSIGGAGGNGGSTTGIVAYGGRAAGASSASNVTLTIGWTTIRTGAPSDSPVRTSATPICGAGCSPGVVAQSIGGGGGNGGSGAGWFSIGGTGGGGGNAFTTQVVFDYGASVETFLPRSDGLLVQSIGGGGGTGGGTVGIGTNASIAIGGSGGDGGNGATATAIVVPFGGGTPVITTHAETSPGVTVQSIGGGGGGGGWSVSATGSIQAGYAIAVGGTGGKGGAGGPATYSNRIDLPDDQQPCCTRVATSGADSPGVQVQSIGGGGGRGGFSVAVNAGNGFSAAFAIGGKGGNGGTGGTATVWSNTIIATAGANSPGLQAQSIGGGGGTGGLSVAGALGGDAGLSLSIGGAGGGGGNASTVDVTNRGDITTSGSRSSALIGQSVGGGGGDGGLAVSATGTTGPIAIGLAFGGSGGSGGGGWPVRLTNAGRLSTGNAESDGILVQSIGGGGGNGGIAVSAAGQLSLKPGLNFSLAMGGTGGGGGSASDISVTNSGEIVAAGINSRAIVAQAIGGGGGDGGVAASAAVSITGKTPSGTFSVALGGNGNVAGNGARVEVTNTANLTTSSAGAAGSSQYGGQGILAQSIGGGGGSGGWAGTLAANVSTGSTTIAIGAAMGGAGGAGGNGADVIVNHTGTITTHGPYSEGILASSIGGGGGNAGGIANLALTANLEAGTTVAGTINIGQSGGGGGRSGFVTVVSTGDITTSGVFSPAISAKSEGGGGGNAGYIAALAVSASEAAKALTTSVTLGGSGGNGRSGNPVNLTQNAGHLRTGGANSPGILAQSLGGGGGNAAYTVSVAVAPGWGVQSVGLVAAVGGNGGSGATSAAVTVTNYASIGTAGTLSHGLQAQSIAGGGGSAATTIGAAALTDSKAQVTVGGVGGDGAIAGMVTVNNYNGIAVTGNSAVGIVARSVGGGGGDSQATSIGAGTSVLPTTPGDYRAQPTLNVSVGLAGGTGGTGGAVTVTNTGSITTSSALSTAEQPASPPSEYGLPINSYGILAQSVGGGGGAGGAGLSLVPGISAKQRSVQVNVTVGGQGGVGGAAGTVTVENSSSISTWQTDSHAIFAQSVGGGGGKGGAAASVGGFLANSGDGNVVNVGVNVGGAGGSGNNASTVTVHNSGRIVTIGDGAYGIFGQSVGGGGGDGGSAFSYAIGSPRASNPQTSLSLQLGGGGGASGSGGPVSVSNSQDISTSGQGAAGILAQSVGGGGGTGGNASSLNTIPWKTLAINVGGTGGAAGNGGSVSVAHTSGGGAYWVIATRGEASPAIYAQSVGGGGGRGGAGVVAPSVSPFLPGPGGSSGNGGPISVYMGYGGIQTYGNSRSYGVWAQSVGGGGGESGGIGVGIIDLPLLFAVPSNTIGSVVGGGNVNSTGSGDFVHVKLENSYIQTNGSDAVGIFAQSVGGGGGVSGQLSSTTCQTSPCGYTVGATRGTGNGGNVLVEVINSSVGTTGRYSHGIFAQSAGGTGTSTAGGVTVNVTGASSVTAKGEDASAVFVNSEAKGKNGVIAITVGAGSTVSGGSGNAAAIRLIGGASNTISNAGTITTALGTNGGVAIRSDGPGVTVTNSGTIVGNAYAGSSGGPINVNNTGSGTWVAGQALALGAGATMNNQGTLEVGASGQVGTTTLTGTLIQGPTGRLVIDLVPPSRGQGPSADALMVEGRAQLAGTVEVRPQGVGLAGRGRQTVQLVVASGGLSTEGLSVRPSVVAQYALARPSAQSLALSYEVDFANPTVAGALRPAQLALAGHLAALHGAERFPRALEFLLGVGTAAEYGRALDRLSPEPYATNLWAAELAASRFGEAMLDCRGRAAGERLADDGGCLAAGFAGWQYGRDDDRSAIGYQLSAVQFSIGAERQLSPEWAIGGALGYDSLWSRAKGGIWTTDARLFHTGLFVRRSFGEGFALTAAAIGGLGSPEVRRRTTPMTSVRGSQDLSWVGGTLRAEWPVALAGGTLRPLLDMNVLHVWGDGLVEGGALAALRVGSASETNVSLRPAVEWSANLRWGDRLVRPRIALGLTQYLTDPSPVVGAGFGDAVGVAAAMRVTSKVSRTYGDVVLGLDIGEVGGLTVGANLFARVSERSYQVGGGLQLRLPF